MLNNDFASLGLMPESLQALLHEGYTHPTPIQKEAIPVVLQGRDLLACAQTGTGKTAAFALPVIQRLVQTGTKRIPRHARALVVAPTRELAAQIDASFAAYGRHAGLHRACVYGGVGKVPQIRAMDRGVDVLVATPGRLLDLRHDGAIDLSKVEIVVFDEADRMLDMGFIHDVRKIIALLPSVRQTLLFSATMPGEIEELARGLLKNPARIAIEPEKPAVELISQSLYYVEKGAKRELLAHLMLELNVDRAIVFSRTKHGADRIARGLHAAGITSGVIHANKGQGNRTRTMDAFRAGETRVLVATDIAARGIDVDNITHIFNFDMPTEPETYVHRIGRTARAGASGCAISFCDTEEKRLLRLVERLLNKPIPVVHAHAFAGVRGSDLHNDDEDRKPWHSDARRKEESRASRPARGAPRGPSGGEKPQGRTFRGMGSGGAKGRPATRSSRPEGQSSASAAPRPQAAPSRSSSSQDRGRPERSQGNGGARSGAPRGNPSRQSGGDRPAYGNRQQPGASSVASTRKAIDDITGRNS